MIGDFRKVRPAGMERDGSRQGRPRLVALFIGGRRLDGYCFQKLGWGDDGDRFVFSKSQEIRVAGDDEIAFIGTSSFQNSIVIGIAADGNFLSWADNSEHIFDTGLDC
ncbi:MAG: hypothetical protein UY21_C0004G0019 [Microgenomates group bacterium GW2011_GWA1_48_10]|nr:MAG: hypothetical protein UY21_C0004G0019 [Microgenomates group bacterium GW2011_GWA1_48_10]